MDRQPQPDQPLPDPAARAVDLRKTYGAGETAVHALDGVTVEVPSATFTAALFRAFVPASAPRAAHVAAQQPPWTVSSLALAAACAAATEEADGFTKQMPAGGARSEDAFVGHHRELRGVFEPCTKIRR